MNFRAVTKSKLFQPGVGAMLVVACGFVLSWLPLGQKWVNASYDYLFYFGNRTVTNNLVLLFMDTEAYDRFQQQRGQPWDRGLHAKALNRLADDGCAMVVFDVLFQELRQPASDHALADALHRQRHAVLMADLTRGEEHAGLDSGRPVLPADLFLEAAHTNWGVGWLTPDVDEIVRHHWPFPDPGPYESLPRLAARLAGTSLSLKVNQKWIRYYGFHGAWTSLSYASALEESPGYFKDKIVFIGNKPKNPSPGGEEDKYSLPYTRLGSNNEAVGGVEILATEFLNLVNGDWLRRLPWWLEGILLLVTGTALGGSLVRLRLAWACGVAGATAVAALAIGVVMSYFTNFWFPWFVIVGGQVPCALVFGLALRRPQKMSVPIETETVIVTDELTRPNTPDYELFEPPFGEGGFGKVWLARNAIGQWQALKAVYQTKFGKEKGPYEAEFKGLQRYKPVSEMHPGLLRVELVSQKRGAGYFYYVMELGDAQAPGWEQNPASYKPRDLETVRRQAEGGRLPALEAVRIVLVLAETLDFLHNQGLTHRDIKPSNVIFVRGLPKLADVGLVAEARKQAQIHTIVGTPGYMPPPPEMPGTVQADIYGLGMLLYVISTGRAPAYFPDIATSLLKTNAGMAFMQLNTVILKACQPDCEQRYKTVAEMRKALQAVLEALTPKQRPQVTI